MNVAVPLAKHSPVFGQCALPQTVLRPCRSNISRIASAFPLAGSRFLIHGGNFLFIGGILFGLCGMRSGSE
jgi:hypothetical protein